MEEATKDRILEVATKLFSAQGLKNTNIRQIADQARANSALIFYYFGCKEKLFYACIAEMASERLKFSQEILKDPQDVRDFEMKLSFFAKGLVEVQLKKKDLLKILHRELDNNNTKAKKIFQEHFSLVAKTLTSFFRSAQKKGIIRQNLKVEYLTLDFFSLLSNAFRNEAVVEIILNDKASVSTYANEAQDRVLSLFMKGCKAE